MVHSISLTAIHLVIFAHKRLAKAITGVRSRDLRLGWGGCVGNKGACEVQFRLGTHRLQFICVHFHAGNSRVDLRNADFEQVEASLLAEKSRAGQVRAAEESSVILFGDLNYRINGQCDSIFASMEQNLYGQLFYQDQLQICRERGQFTRYSEGEVLFAPTYKFDRPNSVTLSRSRNPSWTDRILYLSPSDKLKLATYDSNTHVRVSDHRPVYAQFTLQSDCQLETPRLEVVTKGQIKTSSGCVLF